MESHFPLRSAATSALLAACLAIACKSSAAGTISGTAVLTYDNGGTTFNNGIEMSSGQAADDFSFPSNCSLTGAKFWTMEGYGLRVNALPFDGKISYWIYPREYSLPGAIPLASGTAQIASRVSLGRQSKWWGDMNGYEYSIGFEQPISVEANKGYFLALHMLGSYPTPSSGEFYWASTDGLVEGSPSLYRQGTAGVWASNPYYAPFDFAFQVVAAVPEPSSLHLLICGSLGLGGLAWRQRKQP